MTRWIGLLLTVLSAAPLMWVLSGCEFCPPEGCGADPPPFYPGNAPRTSAIFCNIELNSRCATSPGDETGVDIHLPYQNGFWAGRSSPIGLDRSTEALAQCGGLPKAYEYDSAFPNGSLVCVNPATIPGSDYMTANEACKAWCFNRGRRDGNNNPFRCDDIAWASHGVPPTGSFPNACNEAGAMLGDFKDPRNVTTTVAWTGLDDAAVMGDALVKTTMTDDWDSGARSAQALASGDGSVRVTALDVMTFQIFGLGHPAAPADPRDTLQKVDFGLLMTNSGGLLAFEPGGPALGRDVGSYTAGDVLEVGVFGGQVQYRKNAVLLHTSTIGPTYPLSVEAALFNQSATLRVARASF